MAEHMLRMVGLSREKVQSLLSAGSAPKFKSPLGYDKHTELKRWERVARAYDMVKKGASVSVVCQSWGVRIREVDQFAKTNGFPSVGNFHARSDSKSRKGYDIACKDGMAKAVAEAGVTREAIYAYARRYRLLSPERARFQ
jgi:DNA-binding phage protein